MEQIAGEGAVLMAVRADDEVIGQIRFQISDAVPLDYDPVYDKLVLGS
ncbi:hypothetical protein [Pseudopontixanthobacter vadosimaris]|nr:hypothetical protein [Pseudopontixanthobacter vadosimaris]